MVWQRRPPRLFSLLRRTRWLFLSLFVVYAFATPGEALFPWFDLPTRAGVAEGVLQLTRFFCVLVSLSILLSGLLREQLITGLFTLLYPFIFIGLSRERLAVRLALTLHYAENAMQQTASDWRDALQQAFTPPSSAVLELELPVQTLRRLDALLLLLSALLLWVAFR